MPSQISTHVLDTTFGTPCPDVAVTLLSYPSNSPGTTIPLAVGRTNSDGRISEWYNPNQSGEEVEIKVEHGKVYGLRFETKEYFQKTKSLIKAEGEMGAFYPWVDVVFEIDTEGGKRQKWHVPVSLSRYSYTTYRGS